MMFIIRVRTSVRDCSGNQFYVILVPTFMVGIEVGIKLLKRKAPDTFDRDWPHAPIINRSHLHQFCFEDRVRQLLNIRRPHQLDTKVQPTDRQGML